MSRLALVTVTALLLLAGCTSGSDGGGSDDGGRAGGGKDGAKPSATRTTPAPSGPDCAEVWQDGATLPEDYTRCVEDGAYGEQEVTECRDGSTLVAYSDTFFAITGGRISEPDIAPMQDTEEYGQAYSTCTGE